jgi:CheY-like chemotaxis protein
MATRQILVVDDDPLVADSIRRMLVFQGHQVTTARNAEEALALFPKENFSLTLVDYEMPGMKGDQLAAAIKALAPAHPVVMFTGYAEAVSTGAAAQKVDLVLGKPFDLEQLRRALAQFLPADETTKVTREPT